MLGMHITPEQVQAAFPVFFLGAYCSLRRYRDPMRCQCGAKCLHLKGCVFYVKTKGDRRRSSSSSDDQTDNKKAPYSITIMRLMLKASAIIGSLWMLFPACLFIAALLKNIRRDYESCTCTPGPECPFNLAAYTAPPGCEDWAFRDGWYYSPDGRTSTAGVLLGSSSARVIHRKNERIKRGSTHQKSVRRAVRGKSGRA